MIFIFKVLYYQFFRFYKKFESFGEEPHPHTRYALAFFIAPLIYVPLSFISLRFCYSPPTWAIVLLPISLILLSYLLKYKGIDKKIESERPLLFKSGRYSAIFAILFCIASVVIFLSGAELGRKYYYRHCRHCESCE